MDVKSTWEMLLSGEDPAAHRRLNEAATEVNAMAVRDAEMGRQIIALFELDKAQGRDIARLQSAVWIMMQMLSESGALDGNVLMTRIERAFAELEHRPQGGPRPTGGTPYRG